MYHLATKGQKVTVGFLHHIWILLIAHTFPVALSTGVEKV